MKPYPYAWMNSGNIHFNWFYFISPRHPFLSLPAWTRRMGWRIADKASQPTKIDPVAVGDFPGDGSPHIIWGFTSETRKRVLPYARQQESPEPISCCRPCFTPPRFLPQMILPTHWPVTSASRHWLPDQLTTLCKAELLSDPQWQYRHQWDWGLWVELN